MTYYCEDYFCDYENKITEPMYGPEVYNLLDTACLVSLGMLGSALVLQIGLITYSLFKNFSVSKQTLDEPTDKKIKIIRGVPGIGKRNYVYYLESNLNREYIICDWNNFFIKDGKYEFNGKDTSKAESYCLQTYLNAIKNDIKRIYVIGNFNQKWQYDNYIKLANLFNYKVDITELECKNTTELMYYNNRSVHKIPYTKSLKVFQNWEEDNRAYKRIPYLNNNKAMEFTYLIQTDSENEFHECNENSSKSDSENTGGCVNATLLPNNSTFDNPQSREITAITEIDLLTFKEFQNKIKKIEVLAEQDDEYYESTSPINNLETYIL